MFGLRVLFALLLCLPLSGASMGLCQRIVDTYQSLNQKVANQWGEYPVDVSPMRKGHFEVFLLKNKTTGEKFVARAGTSAFDDLNFENFSHHFFSHFVEALPHELSLVIASPKMRSAINSSFSDKHKDKKLKRAAMLSLRPFVTAPLGLEQLKTAYPYAFFQVLQSAQRSMFTTDGLPYPSKRMLLEAQKRAVEMLSKHFSKLAPEAQSLTTQMLLKVYPKWKALSSKAFFNLVEQHLLSEVPVEKAVLEFLPQKLSQEISNFWLLSSVLGIQDSHSANWLLADDNKLIPIDLAYNSLHAMRGRSLFAMRNDSPLSDPKVKMKGPQLPRLFLQYSSPKLREELGTLTREQVLSFGKQTGFAITEIELQGLLGRAAEAGAFVVK